MIYPCFLLRVLDPASLHRSEPWRSTTAMIELIPFKPKKPIKTIIYMIFRVRSLRACECHGGNAAGPRRVVPDGWDPKSAEGYEIFSGNRLKISEYFNIFQ